MHPYVNAAYYPNWRAAAGQLPADLDLDVLSHVVYAFATVQVCGTVCVSDENTDCLMPISGVQGCLAEWQRLKSTKYPHLKVLISIGGGGGSAGTNFPIVAHNPQARTLFAVTARALIDRYGLDGIDIDWEVPSTPAQGDDYVQLLSATRANLSSSHLLTSALPGGQWALQNINLVKASEYLNYVNLMAYDFYGAWTDVAGYHAELYPPKGVKDPSSYPSGAAAVHYAIAQGVPSRKILLGVPAYGRSFIGARKAGDPYTFLGGEDGAIDYCDLPPRGAAETVDHDAVAVSCVSGDTGWVSYDSPKTVMRKAEFAKECGLGGLFYWHGCSDSKGSRSLLRAGYKALHAA